MDKVKKEEFRLIGLGLNKKTTNQGGQSVIDCGNLWQKFETEGFAEKIIGKLGNEVYAVYFDYEGEDNTSFSYFIGCKVNLDSELPRDMESLFIPSLNYYKTTAKGKMTGCITEAWKKIWNSKIDRTYKFDFEVYDERSKDWTNAEVDIYVSCV